MLKLSMLFILGAKSISIFWPANGFLLAYLLGLPTRWRVPVFAYAFLVDCAANLIHGKGIADAMGFSLANMAEVSVALFLTLRLPGREGFLGNLGGTVRFFTTVALGSAACGAVLGTVTSVLCYGSGWGLPFATWMLVDAAGLAVVTPAYLAWSQRDPAWESNPFRYGEFAACTAFSLAVGYVAFAQPPWIAPYLGHPLPYATMPFLLWAALRLGARGAATVHLGVYILAAWYTSRGQGPFLAGQRLGEGLVVPLQLFPYAAAFCSLVPAVLIRSLRRTESELRMRESRYGSLWTSKLAGIFVTDLKGVLIEANDAFLSMVGIERAELANGINVLDLATPEYLALMRGIRDRFESNGFIGPFEREWKLRDGRRILTLAYASKMNEPDRALGMIMNIQEMKQTEQDLRRRESRYRDLLSSSMLGVFVTNLAGHITEANDTFLGMIRRSRAELEAGAIKATDFVTPEYMSGAAERRQQFQAEGRMGPFDREWKLGDGSRLHTLFFATRMEGSADALCMVLDTNELKRTKMELRSVESRFKKLFDSNIMGVAVMNEMQVFEEANATFLAISGYSRMDLDTRRITSYALRAAQTEAQIEATSKKAAEDGKMIPQETLWSRKDGSTIQVFRGVARLDESNRWMVVAIDLTKLKQAQGELEEAKAVAETANTAKSDFLAHMSHEIRTPLNGVLGMLSLLLDTPLSAEQASYAKASKESGGHLLGLINQILDFSKIEHGHLELESAPFSLAATVEGAVSSVMEAAQKKGLDIVTRIDPETPRRFKGDAMRLQQVLLNLVGNAVKFSEQGQVRVGARMAGRNGNLCEMEFEVSDQGPGLSPKAMDRLFQPFSQGDDSFTRKAGGTGLGLAISRELVRKMGGDIAVDSQPGLGTRFRFTITLEAQTETEWKGKAYAGNQKRMVWILEPQPQHLDQLREMLASWGFETRAAATSGEMAAMAGEALESDTPPDLAIINVPTGASGTEWAEQLLDSGKRLGVPVLCTMPFISQAQGAGLLRAGAAAILTKPFRGSDVYQTILSVLPDWTAAAPPEAFAPNAAGAVPMWENAPRILVVDDHPVNLTVASSMLRKFGCAVETAPDGSAAISVAMAKKFDLIFMDCQMPELDGFETTRKLRRLEAPESHVPIVALTAHAVAGVRDKCLREGMDDFISKPFTPGEIGSILRKWIPGSELAEAGPSAHRNRTDDAHSAPATGEILDPSRLAALDDGTPAAAESTRKLVRLFLDTTRKSLDALRGEIRLPEATQAGKTLHRLKGSCSTLGARALVRQVQAMETKLAAEGPLSLGPELEKLESLFSRTAEALASAA